MYKYYNLIDFMTKTKISLVLQTIIDTNCINICIIE